MKINCIVALAALACASPALDAHAENCSLGLMASLDMTDLSDGRFAVPVSINGSAHLLMVDTAGIFTKISENAAGKDGLKAVQTAMELYGVGGKEHIFAADVASFKMGNVEAKHFHIAVLKTEPEDDKSGGKTTIDGLLASDFLDQFDVELDFAKKKMNLFSQDHCPGKVVYWTQGGYADISFHYTNGAISAVRHINFDMTLDDHQVSTDLDTGSASSWLRSKAAYRTFGLDEHSPGVGPSPYSDAKFPVLRKQFGTLQLGGLAVQNPQIDIIADRTEDAFKQAHSEKSRDDPVYGAAFQMEDFTLGMNVIRKLHLYIAYKEHKVYVTDAGAH